MIRVALSCGDAANRATLRNAFVRCMKEQRLENVDVKVYASIGEVRETLASKRRGYVDYVICGDEPSPEGGACVPVQVLGAMLEEHPHLKLGIVSSDASQAACAYRLDAGFMLLPGAYADFARMVSDPLGQLARQKEARVVVKSSGSVHNVPLGDIQFVESSKKGSVMHMPGGETVLVRGTLQTLFRSLCDAAGEVVQPESGEPSIEPGRPAGSFFVKAGSSFIVNLDNVRSVGEGSLVFADGETIIVPIRKRKALKDALEAYRRR